ncbi:MAG: aminotransferase class V-fold PLP-dependent enzyme, partial [Nocardioides sp.]
VRADTPGCRDQVFLDSAGSSLPPVPVLTAMIDHLGREAEVGGYRAAAERAEDLASVRRSVGRLLGCPTESVALTDSATRAWLQFVAAVPLGAGDRVLITPVEYASNAIALLRKVAEAGASIEVMPGDRHGRVDLEGLEAMLDERVRLVSLVHAPTNSGLVNPVAEVVALAHHVGALVLLDACQSVGQMELDIGALGVDALSATGRKWLRGPRGTGFLHVRPELLPTLEPAAADLRGAVWTSPGQYELRSDASRFELWESSVAAQLGLGAAVDHLLDLGQDRVEQAVRKLATQLRASLAELSGIVVHDPEPTAGAPELSGIVSFTVAGVDPARVKDELATVGVTVSVSGAASTLVDMQAKGLDSVVRASPHYFVTAQQVEEAVSAIRRLG